MLGLYGKYFYIVHTISRVVKSESLQQCSIIKKTAAVKKSITIVEESESHIGKHNRGIITPCCAALGAVAARHRMHAT